MASLAPIAGVLGHRRAAHLLRRSSFNYTKARVDSLANKTATQALNTLLTAYPLQLDQPVYDDTTNGVDNAVWLLPTGLPLPTDDFILGRYVQSWWIHEALLDQGIRHKMMLFFHQFLVADLYSYQNTHYFDYLSLIRWGALGNFKKLAHKMVRDNCMLRYLNNQSNTKSSPNENFAREFFELFTIGKGPQIGPGDYTNYTEDDIVQAARIFTGFRIRGQRDMYDPENNIPRGTITTSLHDTGSKTFSEKFQNTTITGGSTTTAIEQELQGFVDLIFAQEEVSRNLCRRLYRFFVSRKISQEIEDDIIAPLATTLRNNNYEILPVLSQLFSSQHFYDEDDTAQGDEIIGGLIRSPIELLHQSLSFFNVAIPDPLNNTSDHYARFYQQAIIDRFFILSGLPIFLPSSVAGYPPYYQEPDFHHQWFNSSTIISRYKFPAMLLTGKRSMGSGVNTLTGVKLNIAPWLRDSGFCTDPSDAYILVQELVDYLLPTAISPERFDYFYDTVFLNGLPADDWTYEWQNYLSSGNETEVRIALERLITAIMYSPEFQTF